MSWSGKAPERGEAGDAPVTRGWGRALQDAAPYLGLGATLAASVLLGLGAGYWLDSRLGTRPVFFLIGAVLGLLAAALHFYRTVVVSRPGPDPRGGPPEAGPGGGRGDGSI